MRRLAEGLGVATGWALLLYCFAVGVEIVGRRFLGFSLQGVDEYGGYLMALIVAIGFSCALYSGSHIRIDILLPKLPRRLTLWLNAATLGALILFGAFLVWRGSDVLLQSYKLRSVAPTPLLTPVAIPQALWVAALVLFVVATTLVFIKSVSTALRRGEDASEAK